MKKFIRRIKDRYFANEYLKRQFWHYVAMGKRHVGKYPSKRVIMLRLDMIGDCTMFTSTARAIRDYYKDRDFTIVCLASTSPIFLRLNAADHIITVDVSPYAPDQAKLEAAIKELRQHEYDILLQPQASKCPMADVLAAAIKCNKRIAIDTIYGNSPEKWVKMANFLYDELIPYPPGFVSEFDYYGAFARGLGIPDFKTTRPCLPYYEQHWVEGNYYVLYPGGSLHQKFWPADRFARIADYIYQKTGMIGVILGVASEQWVSDKVLKQLDARTAMAMVDLTGRTNVFDVIEIIGNARMCVSNDTSGVHIACATNTPSVATVGGWLFERFLPYHIEDVKKEDHLPLVAYSDMPCLHCNFEWSIIGERNPECLERIKNDKTGLCIENISFDQVKALVDKIIRKEKLAC